MTRDEQLTAQLKKYTLTPEPQFAEEIRRIIRLEIADENRDDNEILKLSCMQLFALGEVEDSILIWCAKRSDFDAYSILIYSFCAVPDWKKLNDFCRVKIQRMRWKP